VRKFGAGEPREEAARIRPRRKSPARTCWESLRAVFQLQVRHRTLGGRDSRSAVHLQTPRFRRARQVGKEQVGIVGEARFRLLAGSRFLAELAARKGFGRLARFRGDGGLCDHLSGSYVAWA